MKETNYQNLRVKIEKKSNKLHALRNSTVK